MTGTSTLDSDAIRWEKGVASASLLTLQQRMETCTLGCQIFGQGGQIAWLEG